MISTTRIQRALATASLALAFSAAPVALHATTGLGGLTAAAKEAESGGNHPGGGHGGKGGVDDHPGQHNQKGKGKN